MINELPRIEAIREAFRHAAASGCSLSVPPDLCDIMARGLDEAFAVMEAQNLPEPEPAP